MAVDVRGAVQAVLSYVKAFDDLMPTSRPRLEETYIDEKTNNWVITVSFESNQVVLDPARIYKKFLVDRETGDVISMKPISERYFEEAN